MLTWEIFIMTAQAGKKYLNRNNSQYKNIHVILNVVFYETWTYAIIWYHHLLYILSKPVIDSGFIQ